MSPEDTAYALEFVVKRAEANAPAGGYSFYERQLIRDVQQMAFEARRNAMQHSTNNGGGAA